MYPVESRVYCPSLRGKPGELWALRDLDVASASILLPNIVVAPLSRAENPEGKVEPGVLAHVGKIVSNWGSKPCLWDPRFLKFDSEDRGSDAAILSHLLARLTEFGAKVIPVVGLDTDFYRASAVGGHANKTKSGVAIRITLDDLNDLQPLKAQLEAMRVDEADCLLLLDLSRAVISNTAAFREFLLGQLVQLHSAGSWARIVTHWSAFPHRKNPCPEAGEICIPRVEWQIWRDVVATDPNITQFTMFGDFGADHGRIDFGSGGKVIPHFRYALQDSWLLVRGTKVYATIRDAGNRLVRSGKFYGPTYSAGDELMSAVARPFSSLGTPSAWRSANMNHQLTVTSQALASMYGIEFRKPEREPRMHEASLFGDDG